jgi:kallikrein
MDMFHYLLFSPGWGKDVFGEEGKYQAILKKIELPIVPFAKCQDSLRKTRLGKRFVLHNSFICAGGELRNACTGETRSFKGKLIILLKPI